MNSFGNLRLYVEKEKGKPAKPGDTRIWNIGGGKKAKFRKLESGDWERVKMSPGEVGSDSEAESIAFGASHVTPQIQNAVTVMENALDPSIRSEGMAEVTGDWVKSVDDGDLLRGMHAELSNRGHDKAAHKVISRLVELEGQPVSDEDTVPLAASPEPKKGDVGGGVKMTPVKDAMDPKRQGQIIKSMRGNASSIQQLGGGKSGTFHMVMDDGTNAVFKPDNLALPIEFARPKSLRGASPATREVGAYKVDQVLGLGLVPPSTYSKQVLSSENLGEKPEHFDLLASGGVVPEDVWEPGEHRGSAQAVIPGTNWINASPEAKQKAIESGRISDLAALDYITGNTDRHNGNWMVTNDGEVYAIDNGYSFPEDNNQEELRSLPTSDLANSGREVVNGDKVRLDDSTLEKIRGVSPDALRDSLSFAGFNAGEVEGVVNRWEEVKETGLVPIHLTAQETEVLQ